MTIGSAPAKAPNPFVGPRAFQQGEQLYGRDHEVLQLLDLLIAERIVLLYSPSGAGKTSLINAGLIPRLQREGFGVLPVVRIGLHPGSNRTLGNGNRYLLPPDKWGEVRRLVRRRVCGGGWWGRFGSCQLVWMARVSRL
jgi:hypothetical protein